MLVHPSRSKLDRYHCNCGMWALRRLWFLPDDYTFSWPSWAKRRRQVCIHSLDRQTRAILIRLHTGIFSKPQKSHLHRRMGSEASNKSLNPRGRWECDSDGRATVAWGLFCVRSPISTILASPAVASFVFTRRRKWLMSLLMLLRVRKGFPSWGFNVWQVSQRKKNAWGFLRSSCR